MDVHARSEHQAGKLVEVAWAAVLPKVPKGEVLDPPLGLVAPGAVELDRGRRVPEVARGRETLRLTPHAAVGCVREKSMISPRSR